MKLKFDCCLARTRQRYREVALTAPGLKRPRAYLNWLRANVELALGTAKLRSRPLKITFDPTNICQLRCPLCPTGLQAHDREPGHAGTHLFERLMEEIGEYLFLIDFYNWGEPLLNPRTEELIALAHRYRISTTLSSNLSLPLSDARVEGLVRSGLDHLVVSLDGASPETYGVYRRRGNFELVLDNVRRILRARRELGSATPLVNWQFLVFRFNEHEVEQARRLAGEIGVDALTFRPPYLDDGRLPVPKADRRAMASWVPTLAGFDRRGSEPPVAARSRCGWHYMSSAVNWDGSVAPCCTVYARSDDFGTLGKDGRHSYMEVLNNAAFRGVRSHFAGRGGSPAATTCTNCPTPSIMGYDRHINRQVLLYTGVQLVEAVRRVVPVRKRRSPAAAPVAEHVASARPL